MLKCKNSEEYEDENINKLTIISKSTIEENLEPEEEEEYIEHHQDPIVKITSNLKNKRNILNMGT